MPDVLTPRLRLHPINVAEAARIFARAAGPADSWVDDFPFEGDIAAVGAFLRNTAAHGQQQPFGYYLITRLSDDKAIGGVGFKGQLQAGGVEIGYGLARSARGHGYAAEAIVALLTICVDHGLTRVIADTTADNIASQRSLTRAGFRLTRTDDKIHYYETNLGMSGGSATKAALSS